MKIERLIGILSILLQQKKVTAPYLAEKFEVSRRTIQRDIEDICMAGIPLVTSQGKNGGISIMEGYKIDRTLLTHSDIQALIAGLKSLDSVSQTNRYQQLMDKLSFDSTNPLTSSSHILIDLSSWYRTSLVPKIDLLQNAILRQTEVTFHYFSPKGESHRQIEPYRLIFQWSSWYIWGYCLEKCDYRMFKLNRLLALHNTEKTFVPRQLPAFEPTNIEYFSNKIWVEALFEADNKWRLIDEYGLDSFTELQDHKLLFHHDFPNRSSLFSWLLSFGNKVKLLAPVETVTEFVAYTKNILSNYESLTYESPTIIQDYQGTS